MNYIELLKEYNHYFINMLYDELEDKNLLKNVSNKLFDEKNVNNNSFKMFTTKHKIDDLGKVNIERFIKTPSFIKMIKDITNELSNICNNKKISFVILTLFPPFPGYNSCLIKDNYKLAVRAQYMSNIGQNYNSLYFDVGIIIFD